LTRPQAGADDSASMPQHRACAVMAQLMVPDSAFGLDTRCKISVGEK